MKKLKSYDIKLRHILVWLEKNCDASFGPCFWNEPLIAPLYKAHWMKEELGGHMIKSGFDLMQKGAIKDWESLDTYALKIKLNLNGEKNV